MLRMLVKLAHNLTSPVTFSGATNLPPSEMDSLQDFYFATGGDDWYLPYCSPGNPWNFSTNADPCNDAWVGIQCIGGPPSTYYHVSSISLEDCGLVGTIPRSIGQLSKLTSLILETNFLSGTIPDVFADLANMSVINLSNNKLTGHIPLELGNLSTLVLSSNKLSGSIPYVVKNGSNLYILELWGNSITGSLPPSLLQIPSLKILLLEDNHLQGSLRAAFGQCSNVSILGLGPNLFSGVIPNVFDGMPFLSLLDLSYNPLTGTLPPTLSLLPSIEAIVLAENQLTGRLDPAFNPLTQTHLSVVYLAGNAFTGQIPDILFQNPAATDIVLGGSCFSGTIPEAICRSAGLEKLYLRCLACHRKCVSHPVPNSNFIVTNPVRGSIPTCLFSFRNLTYIEMSLNYLTGTIPDGTVGSPLLSLHLGFNALTGTIPTSLLSAVDGSSVNVDLSYNRFSGGVSRSVMVPPDSSIQMNNNRLSGPAFGTNWQVDSVVSSILPGNILACNGDRSRLPHNDYARNNYSCGSDNFNKPIVAWICVVTTLTALLFATWYWRITIDVYVGVTELAVRLQQWRAVLQGKHVMVSLPSLVRIRDVVLLLSKVAVAAAVAVVCVLAPLYAGLTTAYGTYAHQYAWVLSAVLLSGGIPFALCFVAFSITLGLSVLALFIQNSQLGIPAQIGKSTAAHSTGPARILAASAAYVIINFAVVATVNVAFVATSIYTSAAYQLGISLFKVGWNLFIAPVLSRWLAYELSAARADWFTLELFVSIMNNIGIPLLAVIIVSPQCLYNLVVGAFFAINKAFSDKSNYNDPFYYSYQCSYVFMDYYSAAFVYASLMASFGTPLLEQVALQVYGRLRVGSNLHRCLGAVLPRILKPVETDPERIPDRSVLRPFFDTTQFLVAQLTSLALILTMGVVFPPLALPVAVTMVLSAVVVMLKVGRLLTNASEQAQHKYVEIIEQECANVATPTTMRRAFWMLLWFGCWFYTLFLFDTLGDAVGFYHAYWVIIVVPLLPLLVLVVYTVYQYVAPHRPERCAEGINEAPLELEMVQTPLSHA
jgi:hypothetical protein